MGLIPGWGTKIPHATQWGQKTNKQTNIRNSIIEENEDYRSGPQPKVLCPPPFPLPPHSFLYSQPPEHQGWKNYRSSARTTKRQMSASPASTEGASQGIISAADKVPISLLSKDPFPQRMRRDGKLGWGGGPGLPHILTEHLLTCPSNPHLRYSTAIIFT